VQYSARDAREITKHSFQCIEIEQSSNIVPEQRRTTLPEVGFQIHGISNGTLRIDATEISADGAEVYPRLRIPIHLSFSPAANIEQFFTLLRIEARLFVDPNVKISDAGPATENLFTIRSQSSMVWNLEFPLDTYRVKWLDARRPGDLALRVDLAVIVGLQTQGKITDKPKTINVTTDFQKVDSQIAIRVPRSHWVDNVLPGLAANAYFLIEIPKSAEYTARAWSLIEQAEGLLGRWDTKGVFAHCREAATALTNLLQNHFPNGSFVSEQRWARAVKEFSHFASLDLHLEEYRSKYSTEAKIERADAECLLIFTKALAKFADELIRAKKSD